MSTRHSELVILQRDLDSAISNTDTEAIIQASRKLILYHQGKGELASCVTYVKSLIPYLRLPGKQGDLVNNLSFMGKCQTMLGEYQEAEEAYLMAMKIYQDLGVVFGIAEIETNLGMLYRHKGEFEVSLEHLNAAIVLYQDNLAAMEASPNPMPWLIYIDAIECCGVIYGQMHQPKQSIQFLEDALKLKEKYSNTASRISALMNIGVTYSEFDLDKATEYYLKALSIMDDSSPAYLKMVLLNNLGGCLEDKGNLDEALRYYEDALKIMDTLGQNQYIAPIYKHIGTVYYKQEKFDLALEFIDKSLKMSTKSDAKSNLMECYLVLSDIYAAKQEYREALDFRVKHEDIKDELFQEDLSTKLNDLQSKFRSTSNNVNTLRHEKSLITEELKKAMNTGFIGVSDSIKEVQRLAQEAAMYKETRVLITGESGVGKEIVARLIHYSDSLNKGRFVDVNCCSIPDTMAESEFFGYVKGAFTGAINSKEGFFEEANQGTLFLDEIGDMPMILQAKLLRVLETKTLKRLGSNKNIRVESRLISATNKDLPTLIRKNQFRADLLYRINTIEIHIPPLRERKEDIEPYWITISKNTLAE